MPEAKRNAVQNEDNIVSSLIFRYLPYWPLFLVFLVIGVIGARIYLKYTPPTYKATASILISDKEKGIEESSVAEELNKLSSSKLVENEMEVIRARKFMYDVILQNHLYVQTFEKTWIKQKSAYYSSPVIVKAKNPEELDDSEEIFFTVDKDGAVTIGNQRYEKGAWVKTPYGELMFDANPNYKNPAEDPLFLKIYNPKNLTGAMLANLEVTPVSKLSTVMNLGYKDQVRARSEIILNGVIATYNKASLEEKKQLATIVLDSLDQRINEMRQSVKGIEDRMQSYRSSNTAVNLSEQSKLYLSNVGTNDKKLNELQSQLDILDIAERYVTDESGVSGVIPSLQGIDDPVLGQMIGKLSNAELEYEKLRKTTGDNNPMVVTVKREIEQLKPQVLQKIRAEKQGIQVSKSNLASTNDSYNNMLYSIPQKERKLTDISRDLNVMNSNLVSLINTREQVYYSFLSTVADSKVIDKASASKEPVAPNKMYFYLGAVIGSLAIAILIIMAMEMFSGKLLYRSEIEKFTKIPVISEISTFKKKDSLLVSNSRTSVLAEQFRQLRASIGLFGKDHHKVKKLLVTSLISGEGKSSISANLAKSIALSGKKVVLVDLDIRNPNNSYEFGIRNLAGVTEYLEGGIEPSSIIRITEHENLFAISAGQDMENSRELLLSGKLQELISFLEQKFDYVILDTSPIDPVTDAYVFSDYSDMTLFVLRHAYTPKKLLYTLDKNHKVQKLKNPVIIFNDVRSRGVFMGSFGYGYGYGYGYENKYRNKQKSRRELKVVEG